MTVTLVLCQPFLGRGKIAYKKGCLEKVVADLLEGENKELINSAS